MLGKNFKFLSARSLLSGFLLLILVSCSNVLDNALSSAGQQIAVEAKVSCNERKTTLNGTALSWVKDDRLGMYVSGVIGNNPMLCKGANDFIGYLPKEGGDGQERALYSYYPYCTQDDLSGGSVVWAKLPFTQKAPYDSRVDFMVGDVSSISYTPDNVPQVNLCFANHLFSILKIDVVNSKTELSQEKLIGIQIESKSRRLSGEFSFDVSLGSEAEASFQGEEGETDRRVEMTYSSPETLGTNKKHTMNVIIPAGLYPSGDLTVTVFVGEDMLGSVVSKCDMTFATGSVHEIQPIDVGALDLSRRDKTVICFGDSITTGTVEDCLQSLLGLKWKVYPAGVAGERVIQIMARSGAIPIYLKGNFTIPPTKEESVEVGASFWTALQTDGSVSETPETAVTFNLAKYSGINSYCGLANPFMVNGVECTISSSGGHLVLQRVEDGDPVSCPEPYTQVFPYAKWKLGDPTVTTCYMGTNGTYTENKATGRNRNQVLADMYRMVKNGTTGGFIAIGYHHGYWNVSFRDTFNAEFGNNYLDLRTYGCQHAETIASREKYFFSDADYTNLAKNIWPAVWGGTEIHPYEPVGARAHAYCIYFKMKELGYLDE